MILDLAQKDLVVNTEHVSRHLNVLIYTYFFGYSALY